MMIQKIVFLQLLTFFCWLRQRCHAFISQNESHSIRINRSILWVSENPNNNELLAGLKVAIVGAGPSGLLLAHRLLAGGATVSMFESRSRPREVSMETRAYALGIGMRGRTAIQSVDMMLWDSVKAIGFPSERFHLHIGPLRIRLRDRSDGKRSESNEPSILVYQTDLCRVMAKELEKRWTNPRFKLSYDTKVTKIDLQARSLTTIDANKHIFDVVVGCDGVNSMVRTAIDNDWSAFTSNKEVLPGEFKAFRLIDMPPKLDPSAVALIVPKAGSCTAFVEPTVGQGCCVLVAGRDGEDALLSSTNVEELKGELLKRFPLLDGIPLEIAARELANATSSKAASVVCNIYHYKNVAALVGDAAHATGGVSGQGVNSALMDSKVLADCFLALFQSSSPQKEESLRKALLSYSQQQVPEGKALYDLSFGPKVTTTRQKLAQALSNFRDSVFRGRWGIGRRPLQTMLTTTLVPFAVIRKQRGECYDEAFPTGSEWNQTLAELSNQN